MRTSNQVIDQLTQMLDRIESSREEVTGQLIVTAIPVMSPLVLPIIKTYQEKYPAVQVLYHADVRTFHLAYGEAHVAFRAGSQPTHPDNVVVPLLDYRVGLFASRDYIRKHGRPRSFAELDQHRFVVFEVDDDRAPFHLWLLDRVPEQRIVLRTAQATAGAMAVTGGMGIGFLPLVGAPEDMVELFPDEQPPEWVVKIWLVTHVDLHRSLKVRSFTKIVQDAAKGWVR